MLGVVGGVPRPAASPCPRLPPSPSRIHLCAALILIAVGLEVAPSPGERPLLPPQAAGFPTREKLLQDPRAPNPLGSLLPPSQQERTPFTAARLDQTVTRPPPSVPPRCLPALTRPLLLQVSPAPSSSCPASCCWSREVRKGSGQGRAGAGGGPGAGLGADRPRPRSLPRDLHLLRRQGPPGLPVLLLALFREVSRGRTAGIQPRLRAAPGGAPRPRPALVSSSQGKDRRTLEPPAPSKFAQEVCPLPRPGKLVPCLFCALTYSRALGLLRCCFVLIKECTSLQERP